MYAGIFEGIIGINEDEIGVIPGYSIDFQDKVFEAFTVEFINVVYEFDDYRRDKCIIFHNINTIIMECIEFAICHQDVVNHVDSRPDILQYVENLDDDSKYPGICADVADYAIHVFDQTCEDLEMKHTNRHMEGVLEVFVYRMMNTIQIRKTYYYKKVKERKRQLVHFRDTFLVSCMNKKKGSEFLSLIGGKHSFSYVRKQIAQFLGLIV